MKLKSAIYAMSAIILFSAVMTSCLVNDADSPSPEDLFIKYYGGSATETVVDIQPFNDQFLVLGNTNSVDVEAGGLNDIYLFSAGSDGELGEERFLDFEGSGNLSNDVASGFKLFNDNIFIIGSSQVRTGELGVLGDKFAFYSVYNTQLEQQFVDTIGIEGLDIVGNDMIVTSDGNYVILCTIGDEFGGQRNLLYTKVAPDGTVIWRRVNNLPGDDIGVSLVELSNGNIAICAETERVSVRGFTGSNVLYLIINSLGFINNSLTYGTTFQGNSLVDDIPTKMIRDGEGAVIVGSSSTNESENPFILPLTASGAVDSIRVVTIPANNGTENATLDSRFNDVKRARNGDFILTGDILNFVSQDPQEGGSKRQEVLFVRTDQLGRQIRSINNFGDNFDESGIALDELADGKILIGATVGFGGSNTKIGLIKANSDGRLLK
ncbi:MAG: hypothetical protein AAFQ94_30680 [Bacteroidota bacterium]